jgi:phosphatidate cytidylyltransferase
MSTWKNFLTRTASALVAIAIIYFLYVYLNITGLKIFIATSVVIGNIELMAMLFKDESSVFLKTAFVLCSLITFGISSFFLDVGIIVFTLAILIMWVLSLLVLNRNSSLERISTFQAKASLGIVYMGLIPAFIFRLLEGPLGLSWFIFLLSVVFSGDTLAYVFGVLFGKHKVMPTVSPKKTWQGSLGGIVGSVLAGFICWIYLIHDFSPSFILGLSAVAGFFGQFGDFFESLLKRVSGVKDSGKIMPGHGGILDRIDGILFAGPVVFFGVVILSHLLA